MAVQDFLLRMLTAQTVEVAVDGLRVAAFVSSWMVRCLMPNSVVIRLRIA